MTKEIILNGLYPLVSLVREFVVEKRLNAENWGPVHSMRLRKAIENKMFPHFLATILWILLVIGLAFNVNLSIIVTGAVANGGLKMIGLFHLGMLIFPLVLCLMFYSIRKEGTAERYIIGLSMIALLFSALNIALHFVDDLVLLMKATEVVAWSLYNSMFSISMYRISTTYLLPSLRRSVRAEKKTPHSSKKSWV